jgi:hypothetical protein
MLRAAVKHPSIVFSFPAVGLCEVWAHDGKGYIFPGRGGLVIVRWELIARHIRKNLNAR